MTLLRKHSVQSLFEYLHKDVIKYIVIQAVAVIIYHFFHVNLLPVLKLHMRGSS